MPKPSDQQQANGSNLSLEARLGERSEMETTLTDLINDKLGQACTILAAQRDALLPKRLSSELRTPTAAKLVEAKI
jgi:hypothetical protein